jgi:SNF2 family DNA or RNA helicase
LREARGSQGPLFGTKGSLAEQSQKADELTRWFLCQLMLKSSGKMKALFTLIERCVAENTRLLVFSQMTRLLDIVECLLEYKGYRFLRLDGQTPVMERQVR